MASIWRSLRLPISSHTKHQVQTLTPLRPRRTFKTMSDRTPFFSTNTRPKPSRPRTEHLLRWYTTTNSNGFSGVKELTTALILANSAVFATWTYATYTKDRKLLLTMHQNFTLSTDNWASGRYQTLLLAAFSHQSLAHFAFNMFALHAFGSIIAVSGVSTFAFAGLALGSAVAGSAGWLYHQMSKPVPIQRRFGRIVRTMAHGLGASGMAMGMGAAATCLAPLAPMYLMLIPVPLPLFVITAAYFGVDAYYLNRGNTGVGHAAHLGGAMFGFLYYFTDLRKYGGVWAMVRRMLRK